MRRLGIASLLLAAACKGSDENAVALTPVAQASAAQRVATSRAVTGARRTAITDAVARVAPAVVTVQTEKIERAPADVYEQFFGRASGQRVLPGLGSGFIIQASGVIVTNAHVVADANRVSVALRDGTTYPAKVLGKDEINDLAVLKVEAANLPVAPLGSSRDLLIGEWAIAIGNPYGFVLGNSEPSVTAGVISGTGRNLIAPAEGAASYVDMVQTDAAINPGNSGGPLVNAVGEVIGVNSSIYSTSGGSIGLGFAIPIDRVRRVTEDLLAHGTIRRPWIGLKVALPEGNSARDMLRGGVTVRSVVPSSPAARAGIQEGDVLLRSRDRALRNPFDWEAELLDLRVGEQVPLLVRHGGRDATVNVTVADLPEVGAPRVAVMKELELVTLTPAIRADRGIRSPRGAVIVNATPRVTQEIGIQPGDVIVQINREAIARAEDVARVLESGARGVIRMLVERGGRVYSTDFMIR